jgi:hypothetical protein
VEVDAEEAVDPRQPSREVLNDRSCNACRSEPKRLRYCAGDDSMVSPIKPGHQGLRSVRFEAAPLIPSLAAFGVERRKANHPIRV